MRSDKRFRLPSAAVLWLVAVAVAMATACSTFEHGYKISDVNGRSLSTASPLGAERLELEANYDSTVRETIEARGRPEFIHVVDRDNLYLFYTQQDVVVVITRMMVPPGDTQLFERTPGYLLKLLPRAEMDAVLQARDVRDRQRRAKARKAPRRRASRARAKSQPPASQPQGVSFRDFDPDTIVKRLRTPQSAADPGVTGWRSGRLSDGRSARVASSGTTRYQVSGQRVTVSVPITPRGRATPKRASHGVHRINYAVFGSRAAQISQQVAPLVSRVAADTSGRTRVDRRVSGRTVTVTRDTSRGVLIYSVAAR